MTKEHDAAKAEIPADVMEKADDVVACVNIAAPYRTEQILYVARAIMAERERVPSLESQIAEARAAQTPTPSSRTLGIEALAELLCETFATADPGDDGIGKAWPYAREWEKASWRKVALAALATTEGSDNG